MGKICFIGQGVTPCAVKVWHAPDGPCVLEYCVTADVQLRRAEQFNPIFYKEKEGHNKLKLKIEDMGKTWILQRRAVYGQPCWRAQRWILSVDKEELKDGEFHIQNPTKWVIMMGDEIYFRGEGYNRPHLITKWQWVSQGRRDSSEKKRIFKTLSKTFGFDETEETNIACFEFKSVGSKPQPKPMTPSEPQPKRKRQPDSRRHPGQMRSREQHNGIEEQQKRLNKIQQHLKNKEEQQIRHALRMSALSKKTSSSTGSVQPSQRPETQSVPPPFAPANPASGCIPPKNYSPAVPEETSPESPAEERNPPREGESSSWSTYGYVVAAVGTAVVGTGVVYNYLCGAGGSAPQ